MERSNYQDRDKKIITTISNFTKVFLLYFFLLAGALWNILGWFQGLMTTFAGTIIIIIALMAIYEFGKKINNKKEKRKLGFFAFIVIISSWFIEYAGVKTGLIFGTYEYGSTLMPQIDAVPVAIGFAWISMLMTSQAILLRFGLLQKIKSTILKAILIGATMTLFDVFMEPAAIKLGYWDWAGGTIPVQNYLAWFIFGSFFAFLGYKMKLLSEEFRTISHHAYIAQLIYFILSYFS